MSARLAATDMGGGSRTIVMLHGFGGCRAIWRHAQEALAGEARTIAYDLPGHGGSLDWPDAGPAKVAVRAILADMKERGIETAHLVGHSMGGAIASLAALAEPGRVASLTLLAPGGFGEEINARLLARFAATRSDDDIRLCLEAMSGWRHGITEAMIRPLAEMRAVAGQTEKLRAIAGIITRDGRQGVIPREKLAELAMPVTVAWGTLDGVLPFHQSADLPPLFGLHGISEAGHMLVEEVPDLVLTLIRRTAR